MRSLLHVAAAGRFLLLLLAAFAGRLPIISLELHELYDKK